MSKMNRTNVEKEQSLLGWLLESWANPIAALSNYPYQQSYSTPHLRLIRAMAQKMQGRQAMSNADFFVLLRSILSYENIPLPIPESLVSNISDDLWQSTSLSAGKPISDIIHISAKPWQPKWLLARGKQSPDKELCKPEHRRQQSEVAADPMLHLMGYTHYKSTGQREAIRAILCALPGSTIIVNLPTGSGKSLCAFLPSLMPMPNESGLLGVSVIVVPTIALALDLDSKIRNIVGHPVAYRWDEEASAHEARLRCSSGVQGPILVSPESLIGSLRKPVCDAAIKGFLRYFIVDEAHMVTAWGDEFRPAFQQIAGMRRELLRLAGERSFITVLMSATLTPYNLKTLYDLFGEPGPVHHVHAVQIRPEPSYWIVRARNDQERETYLMDAIFHLPRPLILYTVRREHTGYWCTKLKKVGFSRIGMFHGQTSRQERDALLKDWNEDCIDVMVATSAFGLGVDKPDIRAILHAVLPEGVDRFYQDVGRGGRDGYASMSLLMWSSNDWKDAGGLLTPRFITEQRGWERWHAMFYSERKRSLRGSRFIVPLDSRPTMRSGDIDMSNELNEKWNIRTLLLMVRAGLIELDSEGDQGKDDSFLLNKTATIRILHPSCTDEAVWKSKVDEKRLELYGEYRKAHRLLERLPQGNECISKILIDCYRSDEYGVPVVSACGGCMWCRNQAYPRRCGRLMARHTPREPLQALPVSNLLDGFLNGGNLGLVYYPGIEPDENVLESLCHLAKWLIEQGVINWVSASSLIDKLAFDIQRNPHWRIFLHDSLPSRSDVTAKQSLAIFIWGHKISNRLWQFLRNPQSKTICILSEHSRPPDRPDRWARDILISSTKMNLKQWAEEYLE